jgi:hypothetical protein
MLDLFKRKSSPQAGLLWFSSQLGRACQFGSGLTPDADQVCDKETRYLK